MTQSKAVGAYIGAYSPTRRWIAGSDLSRVEIPDAWVEHAWKPRLTLLLRDIAEMSEGYYLHIPIHRDQLPTNRAVGWPFSFSLKLQKPDTESGYGGTGYDFDSGFSTYLDKLPPQLSFAVVEKRSPQSTWGDVVTIETIEFERSF